jgi:hypothetical protein
MRKLLLAAFLAGFSMPANAATLVTYQMSGVADIWDGSVLKYREIDISLTIAKQPPFCGPFAQICEADQRSVAAISYDPVRSFTITIAFMRQSGGAPNTNILEFLDGLAIFSPTPTEQIYGWGLSLESIDQEIVAGDGLGLTGYSYRLGDYLAVRPPPPVPEPAVWIMMVSGLALAGAALRHRTRIAYG